MSNILVNLFLIAVIFFSAIFTFQKLGENFQNLKEVPSIDEITNALKEIDSIMAKEPIAQEVQVESRLGLKESEYYKLLHKTEDKLKTLENEMIELFDKKQKKIAKTINIVQPDLTTIESAAKSQKTAAYKIINDFPELEIELDNFQAEFFSYLEKVNVYSNLLTSFYLHMERYEEEDKRLPGIISSLEKHFTEVKNIYNDYMIQANKDYASLDNKEFKPSIDLESIEKKIKELSSKIEEIIKEDN